MRIILSETLAKKNLSQYQLSKMTGITPHALCDLCNNKTSRIDFSVIEKICNAIDCTPNDIFECSNTKKAY